MIRIDLKQNYLLDMKLYQAIAYYCYREGDSYRIATGEAKSTAIEALLSVSDQISLFADKVKRVAREVSKKASDLSEEWTALKYHNGYIMIDENATDGENKEL